jgi:hypothetical protein
MDSFDETQRSNVLLVFPDEGALLRYKEDLADKGFEYLAFTKKVREGGSTRTEAELNIQDSNGNAIDMSETANITTAVIIDDFTNSGNTLLDAARVVIDSIPDLSSLKIVVAHAVFSYGNSVERFFLKFNELKSIKKRLNLEFITTNSVYTSVSNLINDCKGIHVTIRNLSEFMKNDDTSTGATDTFQSVGCIDTSCTSMPTVVEDSSIDYDTFSSGDPNVHVKHTAVKGSVVRIHVDLNGFDIFPNLSVIQFLQGFPIPEAKDEDKNDIGKFFKTYVQELKYTIGNVCRLDVDLLGHACIDDCYLRTIISLITTRPSLPHAHAQHGTQHTLTPPKLHLHCSPMLRERIEEIIVRKMCKSCVEVVPDVPRTAVILLLGSNRPRPNTTLYSENLFETLTSNDAKIEDNYYESLLCSEIFNAMNESHEQFTEATLRWTWVYPPKKSEDSAHAWATHANDGDSWDVIDSERSSFLNGFVASCEGLKLRVYKGDELISNTSNVIKYPDLLTGLNLGPNQQFVVIGQSNGATPAAVLARDHRCKCVVFMSGIPDGEVLSQLMKCNTSVKQLYTISIVDGYDTDSGLRSLQIHEKMNVVSLRYNALNHAKECFVPLLREKIAELVKKLTDGSSVDNEVRLILPNPIKHEQLPANEYLLPKTTGYGALVINCDQKPVREANV